MSRFAAFNTGFILVILLVFGIFQWLKIAVGSFLDWVIALAIFEWLFLIVTVPWNIHFQAKEVLAEARESIQKAILVDDQKVKYVNLLVKRSLIIAIVLHMGSALGLYALAFWGITPLGYLTSIAALLLTFLRPTIRFYQYLLVRLSTIRQEFLYPREDLLELRYKVSDLEGKLREISHKLNPDHPNSWVTQQEQQTQAIRTELTRLAALIENLKGTNQAEHQQLARDAESAIAQLTTDGQFLNHVREIIRFFKEA